MCGFGLSVLTAFLVPSMALIYTKLQECLVTNICYKSMDYTLI
jgi:hypothetical protein